MSLKSPHLPTGNTTKARWLQTQPRTERSGTHVESFQALSLHAVRLIHFLRVIVVIVVIVVLIPPVQRQVLGTAVYTLIFARVIA